MRRQPLSERDEPLLAEIEERGVRKDVTPCHATARSAAPPHAWHRSAFTLAAVLWVNRALRLLGKLAGG